MPTRRKLDAEGLLWVNGRKRYDLSILVTVGFELARFLHHQRMTAGRCTPLMRFRNLLHRKIWGIRYDIVLPVTPRNKDCNTS